MPDGLRLLATRRFDPEPEGEVPLPPGCRQRWGTTRLVACDLVDVAVTPEVVVTFGAREVRVHDRARGALRAWLFLEGRVERGVVSPGGSDAWVSGWREEPTEIPGIGRAVLRRPAAAHLDLEAGRLDRLSGEVPPRPRYLDVDPTGRFLAVAPPDGAIRVLGLPGGEVLGEVRLPYPLERVQFSADGARLEADARGNPNPTAELNDRTPWRQAHGSWSLPDLVGEVDDGPDLGQTRAHRNRPAQALASLRSQLTPGVAMAADPPDWVQEALGEAVAPADEVWPGPEVPGAVATFPGGHWLLGGFPDGAVRVADLRTGVVHDPVVGDPGRVEAVAVSGDGETLLVAHAAGSVLAWDLGELLLRSGVPGA